ncbi:hypothetical protein [Sporomusa sp.]|uniref:hypothetical protein n=1 Tax=Sporomusa sp. TaxID=2078658 RepID=UPI002B89568C|nr:hypothetical protein [Sporomusa sp.]HWR42214.1 hypothetical protein [Sporomusa sp.]
MSDICSTVVAITQDNRVETASEVQDILTNYGCHIRVRLGLHDAHVDKCTNTGIILLQMCADKKVISEFEQELNRVPNVKTKYMTLD